MKSIVHILGTFQGTILSLRTVPPEALFNGRITGNLAIDENPPLVVEGDLFLASLNSWIHRLWEITSHKIMPSTM
jgi:hypothetical protein